MNKIKHLLITINQIMTIRKKGKLTALIFRVTGRVRVSFSFFLMSHNLINGNEQMFYFVHSLFESQ